MEGLRLRVVTVEIFNGDESLGLAHMIDKTVVVDKPINHDSFLELLPLFRELGATRAAHLPPKGRQFMGVGLER